MNSLALHPEHQNQLLVGTVAELGLWDLDSKTQLKVFEGAHAGPISTAIFVTSSLFLSAGASADDHSVTLWNCEKESEKFTFSATEPVQNTFAKAHTEGDGVSIGIVTKSGTLHYFEHNTNSRKKRAKAVGTIQIAAQDLTSTKNGKVVDKTPIMIGRFDEKSLEFVHGSHTKPTFETLEFDKIEKNTCLVRQPQSSSNHVEQINGKSNLVVRLYFQIRIFGASNSRKYFAGSQYRWCHSFSSRSIYDGKVQRHQKEKFRKWQGGRFVHGRSVKIVIK